MAAYDNGYPDENFQHPVSEFLHCIICTNVFKDPVMCPQNEHLFCRVCITRHLMNFHTCPSCMQPLTVETLSKASRTIKNLLSELKIRCEFFNRGCRQFVELGDLETHVEECGYAPAVCSNEGCQLEVNKRDLIHHETAVCERRRVECHHCNDIEAELGVLKVEMDYNFERNEENIETLKNQVVELNNKQSTTQASIETMGQRFARDLETIKQQLHNQEVYHRGVEKEMKESLNEMTMQLEILTQTAKELIVHVEKVQVKKANAGAGETTKELKIIVAGGYNGRQLLSSVELFSLSKRTWSRLKQMKQRRSRASSFIYDNHVTVIGGLTGAGATNSIETLKMNADQDIQNITWENFPARLPDKLHGHRCLVYNEHFIVIGGYHESKDQYSDSIAVVTLPFNTKLLAKMPQERAYHGVGLFDDKIVIVGGKETWSTSTNLSSVLMYDITKNECKELAPLPYPVSDMATVNWGDNIILIGGEDSDSKPLNTVVIYNVKTQKSYMLPEMKCERRGCAAVVVNNTVIVMGGRDKKGKYLKSVESFRFDCYTWEELPEMNEVRSYATAVVC